MPIWMPLCGDALQLFNLPPDISAKRAQDLGDAFKNTRVKTDLCTACGECADVCWFDAIRMTDDHAIKGDLCIGCGYCFDACSTGALEVPKGDIVASVFE